MVKVRVEVSPFCDIMSEWRVVVIPCQHVVDIVDHSWHMGVGFRKIRRPHSMVGSFGLMNCEIGRPHSVMNNSLTVVPFLEVVTFVFLMCRVNSRRVDHLLHQFSLLETLIY